MKFYVPAFAVFALLVGPTVLFSADKPKASPPPAAKAPDDNPTLQVDLHGQRLSDVVSFLRQTCPRFKVIVVPDPQTSDPDPTLPDIELKNIDLDQFLKVLEKTLPQLVIETIEGEKGAVHLFKLSAPQFVGGMGRMRGMAGMPPGATAFPAAQPPALQIYRLSPLIPAGAADRAKALNDILSLVQAALEAQGSANNSLMKVHEATGTLIFRGNLEQTEVVERALKALEPTTIESERTKWQSQMQAERERLQLQLQVERDRVENRSAQLESRLVEAEKNAVEARKRISEQMTEIEVLKARLAAQGEKKL